MITTRYDLDKFHRHMEYDNNTLILAPRGSGKTFALVNKFVSEPDSVLLFNHNRRYIDQIIMDLGHIDRLRDVYRMSTGSIRDRRASMIFIDEIGIYEGDLYDTWASLASLSSNRIVAVTTPTGRNPQYEDMFHNILHVDDRVVFTPPKEYF